MGSPVIRSGRWLLTGIALLLLDATGYLHGNAAGRWAPRNMDCICLGIGAACVVGVNLSPCTARYMTSVQEQRVGTTPPFCGGC